MRLSFCICLYVLRDPSTKGGRRVRFNGRRTAMWRRDGEMRDEEQVMRRTRRTPSRFSFSMFGKRKRSIAANLLRNSIY